MHKNKKVISLQNYFYVDNILFFLFGIRIFYAQICPTFNVIRTNLCKKSSTKSARTSWQN